MVIIIDCSRVDTFLVEMAKIVVLVQGVLGCYE